jgi:zinc protease
MRNFTGVQRALMLGGALLFVCGTPTAASSAKHATSTADPLQSINVDIPETSFTLSNGLRVVVHEDHSAPLVATNIWYHVGSKNEPKGKTGFAHLFEHLMFNGSENFNDDFLKATQRIGASQQNGMTTDDYTTYFQTVPKAALDTILWLESDRMGHLLGAVDQAKLDEQRAVVKNEKRQNHDGCPYCISEDLIIRGTTPVGHPYDHSTIGSMDDLDAASLEDVRQWFKTYYGPSNAVLVLAGDITSAEAREKVEKYFGDIPPGAPVTHPQSWVVKRTGTTRDVVMDRVAQPRLLRTWNVADYASPDTDYLQLLALVLGGDKNSRLYKRLVVENQLATNVDAAVDNREIEGQFQIDVMVKPGGDIDRVQKIVDEELKRLIATGPTVAELARVRTSALASFVRSLESISAKASQLAESETYLGDPNAWKASFNRFKAATPTDLQRVGKTWLSDGDYILQIKPFGDLAASGPGADRKTMPMPRSVAQATFPPIERATLPNGLRLVVAHRAGVPVVNMTMLLETGVPADFASIAPGTGQLAMALLDEATTTRSREQLIEQLGSLGATLNSSGGGETSYVTLSALKPTLKSALSIFSDVVMHPAFSSFDLERLRSQSIASIESQKQDPASAARRLMPKLVFGADSAYGRMITQASLASIGRPRIMGFYDRWFHPNNATLIVAGDTNLAEIRPLIEAAFAGWKRAALPQTVTPVSQPSTKSVIYLVDKPGAPQSVIRLGLVAPPRTQGDDVAREAFNTAFGGGFISRLNMKLREEKGWTYGASSAIQGGRGSRMFVVAAPVQADKTAEAMAEIAALMKAVVSDRPVDTDELAKAKDSLALGLSSDWSTSNGITQYVADELGSGLPDDYYANYPTAIGAETLEAVNAAGSALLSGRGVTWVVVGDRSKIEDKIRALGLGEVVIVDAEGNIVH